MDGHDADLAARAFQLALHLDVGGLQQGEAGLQIDAAAILGRDADAARWRALADRTKAAFNEHYVAAGRVRSDCATVYALAIHFGLLDGRVREQAGERLAELVREADYRVSTGFAGTPYVT